MVKKTLKYGIVSDSVTYIDLPGEFGQSILVINTTDHVKGNFYSLWQHIVLVGKFFTGFESNF